MVVAPEGGCLRWTHEAIGRATLSSIVLMNYMFLNIFMMNAK
jgi:hypothetical protein